MTLTVMVILTTLSAIASTILLIRAQLTRNPFDYTTWIGWFFAILILTISLLIATIAVMSESA
jgi:hypothetical protein